MAVIKRASATNITNKLVSDLSHGIREKLEAFCKKRVIEVGLSSKTYTQSLSLTGVSQIEFRKVLARLKLLLQKHVVKNIPYVSFASEEYVQIFDRDYLLVNITNGEMKEQLEPCSFNFDREYGVPLSAYTLTSGSSYAALYMDNVKSLKWVKRYARYINYLCKKHNVPLCVEPLLNMRFDDVDVEKCNSIGTPAERHRAVIKHSVSISFKLGPARWVLRDNTNLTAYNRVMNEGEVNDRLFASESWQSFHLNRTTSRGFPDFYRSSPEKLFLHMDKGMKMLSTLTRKVRYGSSAFSFRSN